MANREKIFKYVVTSLFMAMSIVLSLSIFSIPVLGGKFYLCDAIICSSALILNPFNAFIVGGIGSFIGDLIFYPQAMFISLVSHGLQAIVISFIVRSKFIQDIRLNRAFALLCGSIIMVLGYSLGKIFVYSTLSYALMKLPFEILQATVGSILSCVIVYGFKLEDIYKKYLNKFIQK